MDSVIPKKTNREKETWRHKDRATSLLLKCQKGTSTKIDYTDAPTLFQATKIMDEERKIEQSWATALDSIETGTRSRTIEIFVNANKQEILDDAQARWENVRNTDHVSDPNNPLFSFFALRTYLEHSCEQDKTKRFIETSLDTCEIPDMARRYDGLVYLF